MRYTFLISILCYTIFAQAQTKTIEGISDPTAVEITTQTTTDTKSIEAVSTPIAVNIGNNAEPEEENTPAEPEISELDIMFKVVIPENEENLKDATVASTLAKKMRKIAANYGLKGESETPRFIFYPEIIIDEYVQSPGIPPQTIAKLTINLYLEDKVTAKTFATTEIQCSGIGRTERDAYLKAIKDFKTKSTKLRNFMEEGKNAICIYYNLDCQKNNTLVYHEETVSTVSDVDIDIPVTTAENPQIFALLIGNEDYASYQTGLNNEVNVEFAANDAEIFKQYLIKTLGVPEKNIICKTNATLGQTNQSIAKLLKLAELKGNTAELIFYYSGHGLPDETTKEAYIIPVDVSGTDLQSAINLRELYKQLGGIGAAKVTVILDACFSGGGRNQGLVAMKGIKIKPKPEQISGPLVVFASSSGEESSGVYKEQKHGIFTYFFLKKLQATRGSINYKEMSEYLSEKVPLESVLINNKTQTPQVNVSSETQESWHEWSFK